MSSSELKFLRDAARGSTSLSLVLFGTNLQLPLLEVSDFFNCYLEYFPSFLTSDEGPTDTLGDSFLVSDVFLISLPISSTYFFLLLFVFSCFRLNGRLQLSWVLNNLKTFSLFTDVMSDAFLFSPSNM
jgi:hypothetical protein